MRGGLLALLLLAAPALARAADVIASPPQSLSVTVYRAPYRASGAIDLGNLSGFALITETRQVHLPAGESRLRFEGVVDGIQSASAIVTGLPNGVIEKNRDAAVLSPETLIRAALGSDITLERRVGKARQLVRTPAMIRAASDQGVVFETAQGVEAYKCSGVAETFTYGRVPTGLASTPTLSVMTRASRPVTATVTLAYLASGFDWAASYVADLAPDGASFDLKAWITLANGNSVGLPGARTQIVAGRLNRAGNDQGLKGSAPRVIAHCWPQETTSDLPPPGRIDPAHPYSETTARDELDVVANKATRGFTLMAPAMNVPAPPPPPPPPPEQLGDLKLYRVPQPTTVAARQQKQVRLIDQPHVPVTRLAQSDLYAASEGSETQAEILLRAKNDEPGHLGLPLPAGAVMIFDHAGDTELLAGEASLRDTAVGEDVELKMGAAPDIQVRQAKVSYVASDPEWMTLAPEIRLALLHGQATEEVIITNAQARAIPYELRLRLAGTQRVVSADQPMAMKDGRPIFRLTLPANGALAVRYVVADQ